MKYPLLEGEHDSYPVDSTCPICQDHQISGANANTSLHGGAALEDGRGYSGPSDQMQGYLFMTWHGRAGRKEHIASVLLPLASGVRSGQFSMSFCSPACLRQFLNGCVDELEARIAEKGQEGAQGSGKEESAPSFLEPG